MRRCLILCATAALAAGFPGAGLHARSQGDQAAAGGGSESRLLYADFENGVEGRPASSRGGKVSLWGFEQNPTRASIFKGSPADKATPELVRTSKADQNHAAKFEYELLIPNDWAGVTMEVQGQPGPEGALPADDVTRYKALSIQAYVTGIEYVRVEIMSQGQRINYHSGYPMTTFKVKDGFNTYKVPLKAFSQPAWVTETRIDPKAVLKRLTSVTFSVYCEQGCRPAKGMVIIDNVAFEK